MLTPSPPDLLVVARYAPDPKPLGAPLQHRANAEPDRLRVLYSLAQDAACETWCEVISDDAYATVMLGSRCAQLAEAGGEVIAPASTLDRIVWTSGD